MKKIGVLLFLGMSILGMAKEFKVMTYNIYGTRLTNGQKIGESIKQYGADFVALQEVDKNTNRSNMRNVVSDIAKTLGYRYYYFQKAMDFDGGEYGISFVSKYPVKRVLKAQLPSLGVEKRQIIIAEMDEKEFGKKVLVMNTHLDYKKEMKEKEIQYLLDIADVVEGDIKILGGDFNILPTTKHYSKITESWKDSYIDNKNKEKKVEDIRIDYIFYKSKENIKVKNSKFINDESQEWTKLSDHFPYISTFEIK